MNISSLYKNHNRETIWIIGSGPTLRLFDSNFFRDKITIGLNKAHYCFQYNLTYNITIHPELIPRHFIPAQMTWITKRKDWLVNPSEEENKKVFWFKNNVDVTDFSFVTSTDNNLYVGRGIHTAAMVLAAKMGASTVILVGCDFGKINDQHHAIPQNVRFHGLPHKIVYCEYYKNACIVRAMIRQHFGTETYTLNPMLGNGQYCDEDFSTLLTEKNLTLLPDPKDDSRYKRSKTDFT